jgi:outer membrane biosynthesis protein TonB
MGLSAEYFISIAPISDAPTTHMKEKALLFQIDFIANDAENDGRRGADLKTLFSRQITALATPRTEPATELAPALAPEAEPAPEPVEAEPAPVKVEAPVEVVVPVVEVETVVKEKPKKVKKIKRAPDAKVLHLTTDLTEAKARIAELEARVNALEAEKAQRKTLKANLRMYEDAVAKLAPIYAGNAFLESSYASAVEMRGKAQAELEALDL